MKKNIFRAFSVFFAVNSLAVAHSEKKHDLAKATASALQVHPSKEMLLEKIDPEELEDYYIDTEKTGLILKLLDEKILEQQIEEESRTAAANIIPEAIKIVSGTGGIEVPPDYHAQNLIHRYVRQFTTNYGRKNLYKILDDGENYRLYIRQELKKRNMPAILEYLPVVESEFKPSAVSRSGAKGLWQFMENSIYPFLEKNEYIDERYDPWLSTDAALSKLQDNYRMFNDWPLAIAAYNCGAGAMQKILNSSIIDSSIIDSSEKKNFWYLAEKGLLRTETLLYVPKLIAISEICEHAEDYDYELPETTTSTRYADFDYIYVDTEINLKRLACELRMDEETLKNLNRALLYGETPPNEKSRIRLPPGMKLSAEIAVKEILESQSNAE